MISILISFVVLESDWIWHIVQDFEEQRKKKIKFEKLSNKKKI